MRRVVVTGLGLVTPLGGDVETTWANLLAGKSGAGQITHFDASDQKCTIACEVKGPDHEYGFDPGKRVDHKVQRQVDPFIIFGIDAAGQALEVAGLTDLTEEQKVRAGCSIGSGIGGLPGIESESLLLAEKGPSRVSPHFVHGRLINLISGQVSIKYGLKGPNHAVVTACSTGAQACRVIHVEQACVFDRLAGGIEAEDDERIDLALNLVIDALVRIEAVFVIGGLHLASDAALLVRRVEMGDRARARFARDQIGPCGFHIGAQRRHQTQTRHHNPAHSHSFHRPLPPQGAASSLKTHIHKKNFPATARERSGPGSRKRVGGVAAASGHAGHQGLSPCSLRYSRSRP